mmetsp:Transcript_45115/g.107274  ORF Transcript_45115/g.107274 Transcript_45115/m.107274 type:complete len:518 (+) Transcript_45115:87-1640(+)
MLLLRLALACLLTGLRAAAQTPVSDAPAPPQNGRHHHHSALGFHPPSCGCSWSTEGGCGISSHQLYDALIHSNAAELCQQTRGRGNASDTDASKLGDRMAMRRAQFRTYWECKIRDQLQRLKPAMKACFSGLSAQECVEQDLCQWGAQGGDSCGIDEERLLRSLVGDELMTHPLVQLVLWADECSEKGNQACEADEHCVWLQGVDHHGHHHSGRCNLNEVIIYRGFLQHPGILRIFDHLHESAMCHARYEHTKQCAGRFHCLKEAGMCRANVSTPAPRSMDRLVDIICKNSPDCPTPCVKAADGQCGVQQPLPEYFNHFEYSQEDARVEVVFVVLASATALYEVECNMYDDNEAQCKQLPTACDSTTRPTWGAHHDAAQEEGIHTAPGMDGSLGDLVSAALGDNAHEQLDAYLRAHPGELDSVVDTMKQGMAALFERSKAPKPEEEWTVEADFDEDEAELEEATPWIAAMISVLAAVLCTGLAAGALCGRALQAPRRQPLLQEESMVEYGEAPAGQS